MESSHKIPGNIMKWIIGKRIAMDNMTLAQCGIREDDCSLYLFLMPNAAGNPPPTAAGSLGFFFHRRTHGPQTYVWRPWLIVLVNFGYSFNDHA